LDKNEQEETMISVQRQACLNFVQARLESKIILDHYAWDDLGDFLENYPFKTDYFRGWLSPYMTGDRAKGYFENLQAIVSRTHKSPKEEEDEAVVQMLACINVLMDKAQGKFEVPSMASQEVPSRQTKEVLESIDRKLDKMSLTLDERLTKITIVLERIEKWMDTHSKTLERANKEYAKLDKATGR